MKDVERKSDGQWTAMVVGSYERADRAVTVTKLVELADFYGIPVSELLPDAWISVPRPAATAIVLDLQRLRELPHEHGALLARYVRSIEHQRGDYNGQVLSIRSEDLRSLAILYDRSPNELLDQLVDWEVLTPGTRPITAEPTATRRKDERSPEQ